MKKLSTILADYEFDDGVLVITPKKENLIDAKEMEQMVKDAVEFTNYTKYYAIIDTTKEYNSTADARNYYAKCELAKYRFADAIVVTSVATKILVNFYLQFNNPPVPTKMFTSLEDAKKWIAELKKSL